VTINVDDILRVAGLGWRVIPVGPDKRPVLQRWPERASADPTVIRNWHTSYPDCNWGLVTGSRSSVFVLDVDAGKHGEESLAALEREHGELPATTQVRTGGGGRHLYFAYPRDRVIRNTAGTLGDGLDTRGDDGFVVLPPSGHPSGGVYAWVAAPWDTPPAKAPDWLIMRLRGDPDQGIPEGPIPEGERNQRLTQMAGYLRRRGLDEPTILAMLRPLNEQYCRPPLPDDELQQIANSVARYAPADPVTGVVAAGLDPLTRYSQRDRPLTDLGNAERFQDMFGDRVRFVPAWGRWLVWDGRRWASDDDGTVQRMAYEVARSIQVEAASHPSAKAKAHLFRWGVNTEMGGRTDLLLRKAEALGGVAVRADRLDADPWALNTLDGTLDLRTGEVRPHDRADLLTRLVPVPWDPTATCPTLVATLMMAFDEDMDLVAWIQRALGYSTTGITSEQCFFICWGEEGLNGKSTVLEAVQRTLGYDYACMTDPVLVTSADHGDAGVQTRLAQLQGRRLASMNEFGEGNRVNAALLKQLTGGDTVQAKFMRQDTFEFTPQFKLWIRTNEKPEITTVGAAMWRRVRLVPWVRQIPEGTRRPRHDVDRALDAEAPGILAWLVAGARAWYGTGLGACAAVDQATASFRTEQDTVGRFLLECVELTGDERDQVDTHNLYRAFQGWCEDEGVKRPPTLAWFGRRLGANGRWREATRGANTQGEGLFRRGYEGARLTEVWQARAQNRF